MLRFGSALRTYYTPPPLRTLADLVSVQLTALVFKFIVQVCNDVVRNLTLNSTHCCDVERMMKFCKFGVTPNISFGPWGEGVCEPGSLASFIYYFDNHFLTKYEHINKHLNVAAKLACYLFVVLSLCLTQWLACP